MYVFFRSEQEHESHSCDTRLCPVTCELCKRLCVQPHLHGLTRSAHHLCGSVYYMNFLLWTCNDPNFVQLESHMHVYSGVEPREFAKLTLRHSP